MAETTCPVFRPTEEEFKNFRRYIEEVVDPEAGKVGLCKIIPPPGWAARRRAAAEELCKSVNIPAPIRQCISSTRSNGIYSVHLVENPPMTLAGFKEYADKRAPFPSSTASAGCPGAAAVGVRRGRSSGGSSRVVCGDAGEGIDEDGSRCGGGGRGYGGGYGVRYGNNYGASGGASEGATTEESEVARRARMFWRSLGPNSEAPVYGADTLGTLFAEDDEDSWNVGKLDTMLQLLKSNLPGITSPMLYAGMWRSMFAFHVEDVNLYSINYLHRGDPKSWYCIPPESRKRFESLAQAFFAEEFRTCKDHMRHKTTMISPLQIQKAGIGYCTAVQGAGEFMITFPAAYHGGFNHGFNLAESTNFAIDRWIAEGRAAGYCRCSPHSVRIDVDRLEDLVRQHRRIAGREATCLNGLAEAPDNAAANPKTVVNDGSFPTRRVSRATPSGVRAKGLKVASGGRGADAEESEEDDDLQVFHCVCNTNVRAIRGVRRKHDGTFVAGPLVAKGSAPWPEGDISECPRCGVWGHTECLEYVLPPQFAYPKGFPCSPMEASSGVGTGTAGVMRTKSGDEGGGSPVPDRGRKQQGFKGARKSGGISVATQQEKAVENEEACFERANGGVTDGGDVGSGDASGEVAPPAGDAVTADASVATVVQPSPPRPICWRCAQEKAEIASAPDSQGGIAGSGRTKANPSRKSGKVSTSGGRKSSSSSSGEVSCERESSPSALRNGDADVDGGTSFGRKGFIKGDGVGGGREKKGAKRARLPNSVRDGAAAGSYSGQEESGESKDPRDSDCAGANTSTGAQRGHSTLPVGGSKRARVGPRFLGKEVLVSDGMAAVLTGVVSAIEDGQARIHYRGRKAKLDEWIDIYSERFLSAKEAKKQMQFARLAMNPSAADISEKTPPVGKKRKKGSGAADGAAADDVGKRAKLDGGGYRGKGGSGKGKGDKRTDKSESKESKGTKGGADDRAGVIKPAKKPGKLGKTSASTEKKNTVGGGKKKAGVKGASSSKKLEPGADKASLGRDRKGVAVKKEQRVSCKGVPQSKEGDVSGDKRTFKEGEGAGKFGVGKGKKKSGGVEDDSVTGKVKAKGKAKAEINTKKLGRGNPGEISAAKKVQGKTSAVSKSGVVGGGAKAKKRARTVGNKPVVIPSRPVVVRREVPEHHVISNRRAAVLARTFEKEAEEVRREYEKQVAAAERSRAVREKRLKASLRHSGEMLDENERSDAAVSSPAGETLASADDVRAGSLSQGSASKGGERWPSLGFGGKPWGLGPFLREVEPIGMPKQGKRVSPAKTAATAGGETERGFSRALGEEDWESSERVPKIEREEATRESSESVAVKAPRVTRAREVMMHRAKVEDGEAVDLGEEEAFRAWLARLRAVQEIPIGHVKKCSRALAVALGTSPVDGSIRASIQALLIAETLRGGASQELARFVRTLAGTIADAASKARPVLPSPSAGTRNDVPGSGEIVNAETGSPSFVSSASCGVSSERRGTGVEAASGGEGFREGGGSDPAAVAIRDMEGVAAYAHALAYVARSASKQRRAWEAHAAKADAANQGGKRNKKGKKPEGQFLDLWPASSRPSSGVVGELPGSFPFSRSADSLLMHVKAMVGLRRAHRWAKAWLALPEGSSIDCRVSAPVEETGVAYAGKSAVGNGVCDIPAMEAGEPTEAIVENPLSHAYYSMLDYDGESKTTSLEDTVMAATALAAPEVSAQQPSVNGTPWQMQQAVHISSTIPPQALRDADGMGAISAPGVAPQQPSVRGMPWQTEHATHVSSSIPPQASRDAEGRGAVSAPGVAPITGTTPAPLLNAWDPATANTVAAASTASVSGGGSAAPPPASVSTLASGCSPLVTPWSFNNAFVSAIQRPIAGAAGTLANPAAAFAAAAAALRFPAQQAGAVAPNPWLLFPFLNGGASAFGFGGSVPVSSPGTPSDPQGAQSASAPLRGTSAPPIPPALTTPTPAVETPLVSTGGSRRTTGNADVGVDLLDLWTLDGAEGGTGRGEGGDAGNDVGDEDLVVIDV